MEAARPHSCWFEIGDRHAPFCLTVALVAAFFMTTPATAQTCGDRSKMIGFLARDYQEARTGLGLASNGAVVELYTAKTGTWTMLITRPGGSTCVIGSGENWEIQSTPKKLAGEIS